MVMSDVILGSALVRLIVPVTVNTIVSEPPPPAGHSPAIAPEAVLVFTAVIASRKVQNPSPALTTSVVLLTVITTGVGVGIGVGVGVGSGPPNTSNAPMSTVAVPSPLPSADRLKPGPRWSVVMAEASAGEQELFSTQLSPASIAGEPGSSACVCVSPPLLVSGPSPAFTFVTLCVVVPVKLAPAVFPIKL